MPADDDGVPLSAEFSDDNDDNDDNERSTTEDELKSMEKIRKKYGINFTKFCADIEKNDKDFDERDQEDLIWLYQRWCTDMAQLNLFKGATYQRPWPWVKHREESTK